MLQISRHGDPAGQSLDRAPCSSLGDVLAPGRIFVSAPPTEFLAVADPLDPIVLHQDDLDGTSGEGVSAQYGERRLGLGFSSKSECHGSSIIPLGCGLSVDYLWVCIEFSVPLALAHANPALQAPPPRLHQGAVVPFEEQSGDARDNRNARQGHIDDPIVLDLGTRTGPRELPAPHSGQLTVRHGFDQRPRLDFHGAQVERDPRGKHPTPGDSPVSARATAIALFQQADREHALPPGGPPLRPAQLRPNSSDRRF